jgi:hypothetical protein
MIADEQLFGSSFREIQLVCAKDEYAERVSILPRAQARTSVKA